MSTFPSYGIVYILDFVPFSKAQSGLRFYSSRGLRGNTGSIGLQADNYELHKGHAITFDVVASNNGAANGYMQSEGRIRIYNLSDETARTIQTRGIFNLVMDYGSLSADLTNFPIFSGSSTDVRYGKTGVDRYLEFTLSSGVFVDKDKFFKKSYRKGTETIEILTDLKNYIVDTYYSYNTDVTFTGFELKPDENISYKSPQTFAGDPLDIMARLLPNFTILWDRGGVFIFRKQDTEKSITSTEAVVVLKRSNGLIDVQYTSETSGSDANTRYASVELEMVGNNNIKPNFVFQIPEGRTFINSYSGKDNTGRDDSFYRVSEIKHTGNTFNGEWKTNIKGMLINTNNRGL